MRSCGFPFLECFVCLSLTISSICSAQDAKPITNSPKTVFVIHGGAGVLDDTEMRAAGVNRGDYEQALRRSLVAGYNLWKQQKSSVEVVEAAIRVMEDCELFNAGKGAAFNADGRVELDASIMEGDMSPVDNNSLSKRDPRKRAGVVAAVSHIKNPISAARAVLEMPGSRHVMLVGEGAEAFALSGLNRTAYGIERVSNLYFWTDRRVNNLRAEFAKGRITIADNGPEAVSIANQPRRAPNQRFGTVGAVTASKTKKLAVGTSTGGLDGKLPGRIGDSPIIGAGTYADDRACGVSCTGTGEVFIRHAVAHDIVAKMLYGKSTIADAVRTTMEEIPDEEDGGVGSLIALNPDGVHAFGMSPKTTGMYRGYVTETGRIYVAIFKDDKFKQFDVEDKQ